MLYRGFNDNARERVLGYRQMAMHARAMADASGLPRVREAYLRSADRWTTLANLVELGDALPPAAIARPASWRTAGRPH